MFYEAGEAVIKLYLNKYASFHGKGLKTLTFEQIIERLQIAPAQVEIGNTYYIFYA